MISINVVTSNIRGFLKELFDYPFKNIEFKYEKKMLYEKPAQKKKILYKLGKLKIFDHLGIFQVINVSDREGDIYLSYNRFLKTDKPYIIIVEDSLALVNYFYRRPYTRISRMKLKKVFNDSNLKALVCISQACRSGVNKIYDIPNNVKVKQIYPLVCEGHCSEEIVRKKGTEEKIRCLYISNIFEQKGGADLIEVFERLQKQNVNASLTIITNIGSMKVEYLERVNNLSNVYLKDFNFSREDLYAIYRDADIFLMPTRKDSFCLVVLEAMKCGCAIIGSKQYAIKEMIEDEYNGYFVEPKWKYWTDDNMPNPEVRSNQKGTILSNYVDEGIVESIEKYIIELVEDREKLSQFCLNSYTKATQGQFSEKYITEQWKQLMEEIL